MRRGKGGDKVRGEGRGRGVQVCQRRQAHLHTLGLCEHAAALDCCRCTHVAVEHMLTAPAKLGSLLEHERDALLHASRAAAFHGCCDRRCQGHPREPHSPGSSSSRAAQWACPPLKGRARRCSALIWSPGGLGYVLYCMYCVAQGVVGRACGGVKLLL